MNILALNAGSSSLKFRLGPAAAPALFQGAAKGFDSSTPSLEITDANGKLCAQEKTASISEAAKTILAFAAAHAAPGAIGHRFVHGGPNLTAHCRIDDNVRAALIAAGDFAPLHNPPALDVLRLAEAAFPGLPQIACLDTAFHAAMPERAKRLPLPAARLRPGLHRYGFHGLSCESILDQLGTPPPRLVIAHLGGGASVTAIKDGRSIDTTMGLTPDGGVMMQTRSGDLDPGLLLYLLRHGETADTLETLLNRLSGIAGISGLPADPRRARAANTPAAALAWEMFALTIAKAIAAMATALGGLDLLVFTGGIGWHDGPTRTAILSHLSWLGNVESRPLPAQEESIIARHTAKLTAAEEEN